MRLPPHKRTPDNPREGKIPKSAIFGPVGWTKIFVLRPDLEWISNLTSKFSPIRVDEISDLSFPNILHNTYFPAGLLAPVLPSHHYPQSI
jgi:hypothetical protein